MAIKRNKKPTARPIKIDVDKSVSIKDIDYKNVSLLKRYLGPRKKILPQSVTRLGSKQQRKLKIEIRKARIMGLLPFTDRHALG